MKSEAWDSRSNVPNQTKPKQVLIIIIHQYCMQVALRCEYMTDVVARWSSNLCSEFWSRDSAKPGHIHTGAGRSWTSTTRHMWTPVPVQLDHHMIQLIDDDDEGQPLISRRRGRELEDRGTGGERTVARGSLRVIHVPIVLIIRCPVLQLPYGFTVQLYRGV